MDTTLLVNNKYDEGKKLLELLDKSAYKSPIVFWMFYEERNEWQLVLGIEGVKEKGSRDVYVRLQNLIRNNSIRLSLENITVKDTKDELLKSLRSLIRTPKGINKIEFFGNYNNGMKFPDSIIYRVN